MVLVLVLDQKLKTKGFESLNYQFEKVYFETKSEKYILNSKKRKEKLITKKQKVKTRTFC